MDKNIYNEIEFGRNYALQAEEIWNWTTNAGKIRAQKRANLIIKHGRISKSDKVLEVGCGTGIFTKFIYESTFCSLTAIDVSPDLLNIALNKIPYGVNFKLCNANLLELGLMKFDVVFGSSVLHHLRIEDALVNIYRVLENNGRIIFIEPNLLNPQIFIQKNLSFIKNYMRDLEHETAINRFKISKILREIGFTNIVTIPHDFLHPKTPKKLIKITNSVSIFFETITLVREFAGSLLIYAEKQ